MKPKRMLQQIRAASEAAPAPNVLEVLTFTLGGKAYGIAIGTVRELLRHDAIAAVPGAPDFIHGIIRLRGLMVPVVDLRVRLGLGAPGGADSDVIVLDLGGWVIGMVVDCVTDTVALTAAQIAPARGADSAHLIGIAALGERSLILIDVESLMASTAVGLIGGA